MASRIDLHNQFVAILGNKNVYFQPPESIKMKYPCIVYKLSDMKDHKADNKHYLYNNAYEVTLIHSDPDNNTVNLLRELPYCQFVRHFASENLNHYVFTIYI